MPGWRESVADRAGGRLPGLGAFVERLAVSHMRRINTVAAVPPTALTACAMLATPRFAAGEDDLVEQIDHLIALLDVWPRSEQLLVGERDAARVIERSGRSARLRRVAHPWGDLLTVTGRDAVLLTYARNNVCHLFAFPSLIAALFRTRGRLSVEAVVTACRALYPFLQSEYYLPWDAVDSERVARSCLRRMVERGLLHTGDDDGDLRRPPVNDRAFGSLATLSRVLGDTLERYALTLMLLDAERRAGVAINRKAFERDCRLLAERLALLSGRRAPEYLDPNVFRGYLDTLVAVGLVRRGSEDLLLVEARVERIVERSVELLSDEVRQTLLQILIRRAQSAAL
jgi:Glycerol-3-phosphate O-acyltransferase